MNATTYLMLTGEVLDLTGLTEAERAYFARCYAIYQQGVVWSDFGNAFVYGRTNPLLETTGGMVNRTVWRHPLFQAVRDLNHRLGIQQGAIGRGNSLAADDDPLADEWLSTAAAAAHKRVGHTTLHQAIKRGEVIARPAKENGTRLVVSRRSLDAWKPSAARQAAKRRDGSEMTPAAAG